MVLADQEEFRVVLAVGILAGTLALIQFWNTPLPQGTTGRQGLFRGRFEAGPRLLEVQTYLVFAVIGIFGLYLAVLILASGLDAVSSLNTDPLRMTADWIFLLGSGPIFASLVSIVYRLVHGGLHKKLGVGK